jgi:glycosyltransferase involved in cell wall biosynthesis
MIDYVIVTTAKNEEKYIKYTLDSVCNQIHIPKEWIIVDDGSNDSTSSIVEQYVKCYPWIRLIKTDDGVRKRDGGIKLVHVWNIGYRALKTTDYEFLVRLDADITLPKNYFMEISECFQNNAKVGLCGGYILNKFEDGTIIKEKAPLYHIRGAFKAFRKKCFDEIGGFPPVINWDGLDEMKAMYLGWSTKTLPLDVIHHRPTSTAMNNGVKFALSIGREYYLDGSDLIIALLRSIKIGRLYKPRIISGISFYLGFLNAFFTRPTKHVDHDFEKFILEFHYNRIIHAIKSLANSLLNNSLGVIKRKK